MTAATKTCIPDYRETMAGWTEAGVPVWASVPERVGIVAGWTGRCTQTAWLPTSLLTTLTAQVMT